MEAKRWFLALLFTFVMVGMFASLVYNISNEEHTHMMMREEKSKLVSISTTFLWLKNLVTSFAFGEWQFNKVTVSEHPQRVGLSPNISSCHKSFAKPGFLVYCCPPKPESDEPVIDFEFPDPSAPLRIRKRVHLRDSDYIAKYTRALSIMKSLPYDDPRSFARQADMHCIYCTGAYNQKYTNEILSIHRSWLFFPWHRMLIYFHERILASLIDDDTFSLSFWNWDAPEGMVTPDMYFKEPFIDTERSDNHVRRPKVADINYNFVETNLKPEEQISKNLAFMYHQMVSGAKKVELFMGCTYKPGPNNSCDGPGTVELAPHNALHSWVGKESNRYLENMGVFYAAARDPIFYAHHSNIDRLWGVWKELRNNEPEIVDPDWLDSYFYFHNEKSQLVRIKIRDVLNITKLGYGYEKIDHPWLNARPKPSMDPTIARHALNTRHNGYLTSQSSDFTPRGRTLDSTFTVKVHRPKNQRKTENEEEILVVYGIDIKEDVYVKFDVYVNAIDATTIGPESTEFAGTYVSLPKGITLVLNEGDAKKKSKSTIKSGDGSQSEL
ncbi:Polyphenol oxidase protein [Thalictrum thalictroides]|uniref:Polyphenol oxidase protein n=1 Tax=Thalictrum thalictroides TaxID=46969 RepID=A0A7J6US79_THATH|nr:Polyphenol oxidase protein [Thalictrum thalictroides]